MSATPHPAVAATLARWHDMIERQDLGDLPQIVHPDACFRSPMAFHPYASAQAVVLVLGTVIQVFRNFRYHRQLYSDDGLSVVLEFSAEVGGRQLKGMDLDQVEIPGTELPAPAQDPVVAEILRIAGGIVERPGAEGDPEPLVFHQGGEKLDRWTAVVGPGEYLIELTDEGDWTARWMPYQGRSKVLAVAKPEAEAKEACRRHHLQRSADELLKKSGDDDLTRADRNGPPEKRK